MRSVGVDMENVANLDSGTAAETSVALHLVAASLEYPDGSSAERVQEGALRVEPLDMAMATALARLSEWLALAAPGVAEERYSGLFDLRPVCTLHVGYHLFGEAYQRGALLSGLVAEMRKAGMAPGSELPDYLPSVLRLLAKLPPGEDRESLVDALLLPALTRMNEGLKDVDSPWAEIVRALPTFLSPLGGGDALPPPEMVTDIDLEADALA